MTPTSSQKIEPAKHVPALRLRLATSEVDETSLFKMKLISKESSGPGVTPPPILVALALRLKTASAITVEVNFIVLCFAITFLAWFYYYEPTNWRTFAWTSI